VCQFGKESIVPEAEIRRLVAAFYEKYTITQVDQDTLLTASELREKYSLSFWDSMIVAAALCADCSILYTEDMQSGLKVEGGLTIVNPFEAEKRDNQ
jgi:predicted nucleic acid-binding protein